MRALLKLFFVLFLIAIIAIVTGILLPKQYKIVKIETFPVSRTIVYEQIEDFTKWEQWSPWIKSDSMPSYTFGKTYKGQLAEMKIKDGQNDGCHLTITHAVKPESVAVDFNYGTSAKVTGLWYVEPTSEGCKLNWTLNVTNLGFFERYFAYFNIGEFEQMLEKGIEGLKEQSIGLKYSRTSEISSLDMPLTSAVIMVDSVHVNKVEERISEMDAYLHRFFERRELETIGAAFKLVYGTVNDTLEKFALGYPIEEKVWVWKTLEYFEFVEGEVLMLQHFGLPKNTTNAHKKMTDYIRNSNYRLEGTPWEVSFFRGDTMQLDTSMWQTQLFYPVVK